MQSDHKVISVGGGVIARNVSAQPNAAVMTDDEDAESVRQSPGEGGCGGSIAVVLSPRVCADSALSTMAHAREGEGLLRCPPFQFHHL
jgi:hypothetical protein